MNKHTFLSSFFIACIFTFPINLANDNTNTSPPCVEGTQLEVLYSVDGKVIMKITAAKRLQYKNGDESYPDGIHVEYYDEHKTIVGELRSNSCYRYVGIKQWELNGDVEIKRLQAGKRIQLNTEKAYWNLSEEKIYTDKFVRIETDTELLLGYGFQANQDLSFYSIQMPQGFVQSELEDLKP